MNTQTNIPTDLFPEPAPAVKSEPRFKKSNPRLGIRVKKQKAKPPAQSVSVVDTFQSLQNGCCPHCNRVLEVDATGAGEQGLKRLDCRIKVVLRDPQTNQLRIKCPTCKLFACCLVV